MKRAFLVSVCLHLLMMVLIVVPTLLVGRRLLRPSAYQVRIVELPPQPVTAPPSPPAPPRVEPPPKPAPPKAKAPAKPKLIPPPRHKAEAPPPLKSKPQPPPEPAPKPEAPPAPSTPPGQTAPGPTPQPLMVQPKIDAPEFDCSSYCGILQDKLAGQWAPPAVSAQGPVQAVVVFTINRDGSVENVSLERSSGNFYFDQAAMRAVQLATPLPPLPHTLTGSTLRVHAPFTLQASP